MIQPGLERIGLLLKDTTFSWKAVHVAGTNGKGSTCQYAATLLRRRAFGVGKFTSPHLVDRWDCIEINREPVKEDKFKRMEEEIQTLNLKEGIGATPFEILTATAFHLFNRAKVTFGVVEVGMGGTLDATNILNNQVVSVITKISKDHENFLGNTIEEIARHKAGILRPNVPYIVNPMNDLSVQDVIDDYAKEIGAGPRLVGDTPHLRATLYSRRDWKAFAASTRPFQRDNAVLGIIATKAALKSVGAELKDDKIAEELLKPRASQPGRVQFKNVTAVFGGPHNNGRRILVDGAHNPDAALALHDVVAKEGRKLESESTTERRTNRGRSVTWVLAMTEGKDTEEYLKILLKNGDSVITTTFDSVDGMPWVKPVDPKVLFDTAKYVRRGIKGFAMPKGGVLRALCAARYMSRAKNDDMIILTGSLYLVGDLHRETRSFGPRFWQSNHNEDARQAMKIIHKEEHDRVSKYLGLKNLQDRFQDPDSLDIDVSLVIRKIPDGGMSNDSLRDPGSPRIEESTVIWKIPTGGLSNDSPREPIIRKTIGTISIKPDRSPDDA